MPVPIKPKPPTVRIHWWRDGRRELQAYDVEGYVVEELISYVAEMVRNLTPEQRALVVHVEHDAFDTYIGRIPTYGNPRWGNPEKLSAHQNDRKKCMRAYVRWLLTSDKGKLVMEHARVLKGRRLGCHCRGPETPNALCHGLVLVALSLVDENHDLALDMADDLPLINDIDDIDLAADEVALQQDDRMVVFTKNPAAPFGYDVQVTLERGDLFGD